MTESPVGEKYDLVAEINMIPLIDVSLVLLIIFMVLTPVLVRSQIKVNLPEAEAPETRTSEDQVLIVQIDRSGSTWIEGKSVAAADLGNALAVLLGGGGSHMVVLEADKQVAFEHVVDVMDAAKKGGAEKLAVSVLTE